MQGTPRTAPSPVRIIHFDDSVVVAETGPICVTIWRGAVTKGSFERQRDGLADVVKRHPHGGAFICVIEPSAKPPEDDLRRQSTQMVLSHGDRLKCVACVIEGEGFRASIARGALSGMVLLLRNRKAPVSFFANVRSAGQWMSEYTQIPSIDAFSSTVEYIRSHIPAHELTS